MCYFASFKFKQFIYWNGFTRSFERSRLHRCVYAFLCFSSPWLFLDFYDYCHSYHFDFIFWEWPMVISWITVTLSWEIVAATRHGWSMFYFWFFEYNDTFSQLQSIWICACCFRLYHKEKRSSREGKNFALNSICVPQIVGVYCFICYCTFQYFTFRSFSSSSSGFRHFVRRFLLIFAASFISLSWSFHPNFFFEKP